MRLEPKGGLSLDIEERFRKELQGMPKRVRLQGNAMHQAIARRLLERSGSRIEIASDGEEVRLMSLEAWGAAHLKAFLDGTQEPLYRCLLRSIPEDALVGYAQRHGIPVVREERDDARRLVDEIAKEQPQTPFSLARSIERLKELGRSARK